MEIVIDLNRISEIINYSPWQLFWVLFKNGGWAVVALGLIVGLFLMHLERRRIKYLASFKQNLLAIDIPKDNEQSLLAVEQIFAQLHGIKSSPTLYERYWLGKNQLTFSLEIVSIEGYIQFLIRTPEAFRDLVEAAVYAQYPEAEITEVEDYIRLIPADVYDIKSDFNFWGTEFTLAKSSIYPIKTYKFFEHGLEQVFVDPMASLLEVMSKIGPGEKIGLQLVIAPVGDSWKSSGSKIINKLIGSKLASKEGIADKIVKTALGWLETFSESIYSIWGDIEDKSNKKADLPNLIQYMTTGEKIVIEAIQNKLSKLSFASSFRIYYLALKEVYTKGRGVNSLIGAINQFNSSDLNSFVKYKKLTSDADYFFVNKRITVRKRKLLRLFKNRSRKGSTEFYLNTEELATLFHFPTISVKAPLLKRTEWRTAEPPTSIPLETTRESAFFAPAMETEMTRQQQPETSGKIEPAIELPISHEDNPDYIIKESLPGYDFDNNYFEKQFSKETKNNIQPPTGLSPADEQPPVNLPFVN